MIIKEARIDDRLIHGQIVTAWIQETKAKAILVADNKAASDEFTQKLLKMVVPQGIQLIIQPLKVAAALVKRDVSEVPVLLIVRSAAEALELLRLGVSVDHWTLGNITGRKSDQERVNVLKYVWATQSDADALKEIRDAGVEVRAQSVPSERSYDIIDLLDKTGFYR